MKKIIKGLIIFVLASITTISLNINLDTEVGLLASMTGNNIIYVLLFAIFCATIQKSLQQKDKRLIICMLSLSVVLALFHVIGYSIDNTMSLDGILLSRSTLLKSMIKLVGTVTLIYMVLIVLYTKLIPYMSSRENNQIKLFNTNKKNFWILWALIILAWLPYFLKYFPAIITPDSLDQICQTQGINTLTNHHPIFHTFLIGIAVNIGKFFGSYNIGVAIYSTFQMIALSGIFSFVLYDMSKKNIYTGIKIAGFLFFALYPVFGIYSLTMWKDIPFAIVMLFFILQIVELVRNTESFFANKKRMFTFIISMLLVIVFRNNGIYIVFLTIPFLLWFYRKNWKKILPITIIPIIFYVLYTGPVFQICKVQKGSIREALSIPLQQFARIKKEREDELNQEQIEKIHHFLPVEDIEQRYNPTLSDPVKACFDDAYFSEHKGEFLVIWAQLVFQFPREAIESFLCNSYGYWYPETTNSVVSRVIIENELGLHSYPLLQNSIFDIMDDFIDYRNIPVFSMIFSVGIMFWINLICLVYVIYQKQYKRILVFIPILAMWLTTIASPVFCEYRYVFSMIVSIPVMISMLDIKQEEIEKSKE